MFLPSKSRFNRKLLKRKTQSKKRNDSGIITCFFGENFHDFPFLRNVSVDHVFIASYASVKRNPKSAMTAGKSHVFLFFGEDFHDFPFFMQRFCPVNNILMANYTRVKHNKKSAMTAKKSHFHDFPLIMHIEKQLDIKFKHIR